MQRGQSDAGGGTEDNAWGSIISLFSLVLLSWEAMLAVSSHDAGLSAA